MSFCKAIVIVDSKTDPQNDRDVLEALLSNLDLTTDLTFSKGVLDVLDHSSPFPTFGNKIGIDLTPRFKDEPPRAEHGPVPPPGSAESILDSVRKHIPQIAAIRPLFKNLAPDTRRTCSPLAVNVTHAASAIAPIMESTDLKPYNIIILFDNSIDLSDNSLLLWKIFNNVDPGRDLTFKGNRVVINACIKGPEDGHDREWPDELTFDP
jgi:4-hydroxy-3-polyprenylbenzoate decarboxylase